MMSYLSKDELDNFSYEDCIVNQIVFTNKDIQLYVEALVVKASNSQNSNYTDSYAGEAQIILTDGTIIRVVKEGYKYYNANDELVNAYPDEEMDLLSENWDSFFSKTFLIGAHKEEDLIVLEFELPNEEPAAITESYEVTIRANSVTVSWDHYMNRVQ